MNNFIVIVNHNRHTNDEFFVFPNTENGIKEAKNFFDKKKIELYPDGSKMNSMGEDDWGYNEDYAIYMNKSSN